MGRGMLSGPHHQIALKSTFGDTALVRNFAAAITAPLSRPPQLV